VALDGLRVRGEEGRREGGGEGTVGEVWPPTAHEGAAPFAPHGLLAISNTATRKSEGERGRRPGETLISPCPPDPHLTTVDVSSFHALPPFMRAAHLLDARVECLAPCCCRRRRPRPCRRGRLALRLKVVVRVGREKGGPRNDSAARAHGRGPGGCHPGRDGGGHAHAHAADGEGGGHVSFLLLQKKGGRCGVAGGPKKGRDPKQRRGGTSVHTSILLVVLTRPLPKHLLQLDSDLCGVVSVEDVADKVALCPHRQHLQPPADDPAHEVAVPQLAVRRGELDKVCAGVGGAGRWVGEE
jgi:hypothetical protein